MIGDEKEQISEDSRKKLLNQMKKKEETVRLYLTGRRRYLSDLLAFGAQIATGIIAVCFIIYEGGFMVTIPYLNWIFPSYWLFLLALALNTLGYSIITRSNIRELRKQARSICFHASVSGAESIAQKKMVEGAFYVVTLFRFIKQYSDEAKVKIGPWNSKIRGLFLGMIENLYESRNAIGKAVMNGQGQRANLSHNLYKLADSLFLDEKDPDYDGALSSLRFFQDVGEKYAEPATFAQRHRTMGFVSKIISEFLKATIVYILIFILWLISGYK